MESARIRRYLRHGTLPQLMAFEATARLGSCSRAAELLHQSQPTVSIHIKKLSESFGQALFERAGRGMRLTPAGQAVYDTCRVLFSTLEALDDLLAAQTRDPRTTPHAIQALEPLAGQHSTPTREPLVDRHVAQVHDLVGCRRSSPGVPHAASLN